MKTQNAHAYISLSLSLSLSLDTCLFACANSVAAVASATSTENHRIHIHTELVAKISRNTYFCHSTQAAWPTAPAASVQTTHFFFHIFIYTSLVNGPPADHRLQLLRFVGEAGKQTST